LKIVSWHNRTDEKRAVRKDTTAIHLLSKHFNR
jgi:hypothetical protein